MYGLSQWETTLHCNVVSHWLSSYTEWPLTYMTLNSNGCQHGWSPTQTFIWSRSLWQMKKKMVLLNRVLFWGWWCKLNDNIIYCNLDSYIYQQAYVRYGYPALVMGLTYWGLNKIADISQTIFSYAFSCMKIEFLIRFHSNLFQSAQLTIPDTPTLV